MAEIACIGCGCSDRDPCDGGCGWLEVDRAAGVGVCSSCPEEQLRFRLGDRELTEEAAEAVELRAEMGGGAS